MKRVLKILAIIIGVLVILFLFMPGYVKKAVWYWGPSIDDYKIFHNRVIEAGVYQPWELDEDYNRYIVPDSIEEIIERYDPVAGLVIQDGKIKYEE